jgi:hypothetical protein
LLEREREKEQGMAKNLVAGELEMLEVVREARGAGFFVLIPTSRASIKTSNYLSRASKALAFAH